MSLHQLIGDSVAAMVEFYDNSPASDQANTLTEEVKAVLGADAPVYRVNISDNPREMSLVHLDTIPTIIIYRNDREEWRITSQWPSARALAARLKESMLPPGAVNPLKGRKRS